jgi:hypothetical protein
LASSLMTRCEKSMKVQYMKTMWRDLYLREINRDLTWEKNES